MLKGIAIKNYKAFRSEELELRPITVFIGRNSSGKSSLCKLIEALSESFRGEATDYIPLQTAHNRLGDNYADLFYQRITNDMHIEASFDGNKSIEATLLMQGGDFCPRSYTVKNGQTERTRVFDSVAESAQAGFSGLYLKPLCEETGVRRDDVTFSVDYIGPVRCRAMRRVERAVVRRGTYVGDDGARAYEMLLLSHLGDGRLLQDVSSWCEENMDGQRLVMSEQSPGTGVYSLYVERKGLRVNIADVGEGLAQVLPVIVQSYERNADITIIEQPALHLNPAAHALVASRLAVSSVKLGKKYIIESHSDTFLSGIRKQVAERVLPREDVVIYCVHHDGEKASLEKIGIDDRFEYTSWPEGMFEDDYRLQNEINHLIG